MTNKEPAAARSEKDLIREWDPARQKIVTKDRVTYFADKYRASESYGLKATGFEFVVALAGFIALAAYSNASSTARMACTVVQAAWSVKEEALDDDKPAPKWLGKSDVDAALEICSNNGYLE
jgi:hypothetical protein